MVAGIVARCASTSTIEVEVGRAVAVVLHDACVILNTGSGVKIVDATVAISV